MALMALASSGGVDLGARSFARLFNVTTFKSYCYTQCIMVNIGLSTMRPVAAMIP